MDGVHPRPHRLLMGWGALPSCLPQYPGLEKSLAVNSCPLCVLNQSYLLANSKGGECGLELA